MYLKIKVIANAKVDTAILVSEDEIRVTTKMPAERNLANSAMLQLIREMYPNKSVRLVNGHHSPSKIVSIE